jgi:hypothetical protein
MCAAGLGCQGGTCVILGAGSTGQRCTSNVDCTTNVCVPIGGGAAVCSTPCTGTGACVPGWSCANLLGQPTNVCQCTASPEVCDGVDNDCNGLVDDGTGPAQDCYNRFGASYACRAGACTCTSLCGGVCTDLTSDAQNCGACGVSCFGAPQVVSGACSGGACHVQQCTTGWGDCNGLYSDGCEADLATDNNNCGACGNQCFAANNMVCMSSICVAAMFTHNDGFGDTWTDATPLGTYTQSEAMQACFAYGRTHAGLGCGVWSGQNCCNFPNAQCTYASDQFGAYRGFWLYTIYPGSVQDGTCASVGSWQ